MAYGSGSTLHRYYLRWARSGVFHRIWESGLAEADEMEGIAWRWGVACTGSRCWHPATTMRAGAAAP